MLGDGGIVGGVASGGVLFAGCGGVMVPEDGVTGAGGVGDSGGLTGVSSAGSANGPIGSPSSPVSSSGTVEGAAMGSEKTGSIFVLLVISSIAFCKSLSTV